MRAIFIDAVGRKVEEVEIENKLEAFYAKIGCEMIEPIALGRKFVMIVDEEGKLRDWKVGFRLGDAEGIAGMTQFLDLEKTPLPPPAFGIAILTDLRPESIAKARAEAMRDLEQHR